MEEFHYGAEGKYINITEEIHKYTSEGIVSISGNYNELFGDSNPGKLKHIKIVTPELGEIKIKENTPFQYRLIPQPQPKLYVVYFINTYCNPSYDLLMKAQLQHLSDCGLVEKATVFVEILGNSCKPVQEVLEILPKANISLHPSNNHEYYGIKRVWELGHTDPTGYILYFHSKDITRNSIEEPRTDIERNLFRKVVEEWYHNIQILNHFPSINKISWLSSYLGWAWYNFFWVRGSYVSYCEIPMETYFRYYYEHWLSKKLHDKNNYSYDYPRVIDSPDYQQSNHDIFNIYDKGDYVPIGVSLEEKNNTETCHIGETYYSHITTGTHSFYK